MAEPRAMRVGTVSDLRASDAERAEVADLLTHHFVDGRLDGAELDERLGAALSAKSRSELAAQLYDLPRIVASRPERHSPRPRALRLMAPIAFLCLLGCLVIAAASSLSVHSATVARAGVGGQASVISQGQGGFSLSPALVALLLVAIVFFGVRFFRFFFFRQVHQPESERPDQIARRSRRRT